MVPDNHHNRLQGGAEIVKGRTQELTDAALDVLSLGRRPQQVPLPEKTFQPVLSAEDVQRARYQQPAVPAHATNGNIAANQVRANMDRIYAEMANPQLQPAAPVANPDTYRDIQAEMAPNDPTAAAQAQASLDTIFSEMGYAPLDSELSQTQSYGRAA